MKYTELVFDVPKSDTEKFYPIISTLLSGVSVPISFGNVVYKTLGLVNVNFGMSEKDQLKNVSIVFKIYMDDVDNDTR